MLTNDSKTKIMFCKDIQKTERFISLKPANNQEGNQVQI
jgi:hypothetical protein